MLHEHQVQFLLDRCETALGRELKQIRDKLKTARSARHMIWELILLDAALALGPVQYEPRTANDRAPDIFLNSVGGMWLEAAYIEADDTAAADRAKHLRTQLQRAARNVGLRPTAFYHCLYGGRRDLAESWPPTHDSVRLMKEEPMRSFFERVAASPEGEHLLDLASAGFRILIGYSPSSTVPSRMPIVQKTNDPSEHPVFAKLDKKGLHYTRSGLHHPLVVCVGAEDSLLVTRFSAFSTTTIQDAAAAAFARRPLISAALVTSIEYEFGVAGRKHSRKAYSKIILNPGARFPLTSEASALLHTLDLSRVEYGHARKDWEASDMRVGRLQVLSGAMQLEHRGDRLTISLPAHVVYLLLAGDAPLDQLLSKYSGRDNNPFALAVSDGREIIAVRLVTNSQLGGSEAAAIAFDFGPPRPHIVRVKKKPRT